MKWTKKLTVLAVSSLMLSACGQEDSNNVKETSGKEKVQEEKAIKKHESVKLPVKIYSDSKYKVSGEQVGFHRTITSMEKKDFDESLEIEFYDYFDHRVSNRGLNLSKDYTLFKINMKHETEKPASSRPLKAFMLSRGSGLMIGENELARQDDFIQYQQDFLALDSKTGTSFDETGNILLAVPKKYADDPNLQLRVKQEINETKQYIYIDLN